MSSRFVGLVFALLLAGWLLFRLGDDGPEPSLEATSSEAAAPRADPIPVAVRSCERSDGSLRIVGSLRNEVGVTVRYIEVLVGWNDASGSVIDTRVVPAVGTESLMAGEETTFEAATDHPQALHCTAELFSYEPTP